MNIPSFHLKQEKKACHGSGDLHCRCFPSHFCCGSSAETEPKDGTEVVRYKIPDTLLMRNMNVRMRLRHSKFETKCKCRFNVQHDAFYILSTSSYDPPQRETRHFSKFVRHKYLSIGTDNVLESKSYFTYDICGSHVQK